ncbi:hypothetical protein [Candidatus Similichlamydia laticola]|uniref:Uncharacterized protein n=1 Tax=Candidatus Similichlamydia laticola TaxID=2170265 RepID=A0A369KED9_9BACT|nr:hypothetical protein [Candidatus Similichlamydia laticola]RDB31820.1 hypothetical protein HAT2_00071 [Candidatus Similichlamydia laticola]
MVERALTLIDLALNPLIVHLSLGFVEIKGESVSGTLPRFPSVLIQDIARNT